MQQRKLTQTSFDWIQTNAESRYLALMRQGAQFDPQLAEAVNRIDAIIAGGGSTSYDAIIVAASTNTRVGNIADSLIDANGASRLGNAAGSTSVIEIDVTQSLVNDTITALTG